MPLLNGNDRLATDTNSLGKIGLAHGTMRFAQSAHPVCYRWLLFHLNDFPRMQEEHNKQLHQLGHRHNQQYPIYKLHGTKR